MLYYFHPIMLYKKTVNVFLKFLTPIITIIFFIIPKKPNNNQNYRSINYDYDDDIESNKNK